MSKKGGRPRALDESKQREVCALISAGASLRHAAKYVGCSHKTIQREANRNKTFQEQLRRAQATTQLAPLQAMRQASQTNWRAAAWMLERSDPEHFGRKNPRAIGAKELRTLGRDLIAIFNDVIDHPILREEVLQRVKATINYAMHHAWDTHRTGNSLREAMQFFDQKDKPMTSADSPLGLSFNDLFDFVPPNTLEVTKPQEFRTTPSSETSEKTTPNDAPGRQNPEGFVQKNTF